MDSFNLLNKKQEDLNRIINSKNKLDLIKNNFFLIKLFGIIHKKKQFEIIKHNKNTQKRIHIDINDFKELFKIEIEIVPSENINYFFRSTQFININEVDQSYYHIFFDDSKIEERRNYFVENDKVTKIRIIIDYEVKSLEGLFKNCFYINSISFKKFYRNDINNMSEMFYECAGLKELDLSNFNTDNVINMKGMFFDCSSIKELNLFKFNTNNVTNMMYMFYGCSSIIQLNLSNFSTDNVTDMNHMFYGCSSLKRLNLSNFKTNNVTDMSYMFFECSSLEDINISNFIFNDLTNIDSMFFRCSDTLKCKVKNQNPNLKNEALYLLYYSNYYS